MCQAKEKSRAYKAGQIVFLIATKIRNQFRKDQDMTTTGTAAFSKAYRNITIATIIIITITIISIISIITTITITIVPRSQEFTDRVVTEAKPTPLA